MANGTKKATVKLEMDESTLNRAVAVLVDAGYRLDEDVHVLYGNGWQSTGLELVDRPIPSRVATRSRVVRMIEILADRGLV